MKLPLLILAGALAGYALLFSVMLGSDWNQNEMRKAYRAWNDAPTPENRGRIEAAKRVAYRRMAVAAGITGPLTVVCCLMVVREARKPGGTGASRP